MPPTREPLTATPSALHRANPELSVAVVPPTAHRSVLHDRAAMRARALAQRRRARPQRGPGASCQTSCHCPAVRGRLAPNTKRDRCDPEAQL